MFYSRSLQNCCLFCVVTVHYETSPCLPPWAKCNVEPCPTEANQPLLYTLPPVDLTGHCLITACRAIHINLLRQYVVHDSAEAASEWQPGQQACPRFTDNHC